MLLVLLAALVHATAALGVQDIAVLSVGPDLFSPCSPATYSNGSWRIAAGAAGSTWAQSTPAPCIRLGAGAALQVVGVTLAGNQSVSVSPTLGLLLDSVALLDSSASVTVQNSTIVLAQGMDCAALGYTLCSSMANFTAVVVTTNQINLGVYRTGTVSWYNSTIQCGNSSNTLPQATSTCAAASVTTHADIASSLQQLQATHSNVTLIIQADTHLALDPNLPYMDISSYVTLRSSVSGSLAWMNHQGTMTFVRILPQPTAYLTLYNIAMYNLPFGTDSAFPGSVFVGYLWGFNMTRGPVTYLNFTEVVFVLPDDLYTYLSYWYSRYVSPIPSVRDSAAWLGSNVGITDFSLTVFEVGSLPSTAYGGRFRDSLYNTVRRTPGNSWTNIVIVPASTAGVTLQPQLSNSGVMQIGSTPYTITSRVAPSCSAAQLTVALANATAVKPNVAQICNVSLSSANSSNALPPLLLPVTTLANTNVFLQGQPLRVVVMDIGSTSAVVVGQGSSLVLHDLILLNAGVPAPAGSALSLASLTFAMWSITGLTSSASLVLDNVSLVVTKDELDVLVLFARGASTCSCNLERDAQQRLRLWAASSQFAEVRDDRLTVASWGTWRWSGSQVVVVSGNSTAWPYPVLPRNVPIQYYPESATADTNSNVPVAAIAVPAAVGGALLLAALAFLLRRHRRRSQGPARSDKAAPYMIAPGCGNNSCASSHAVHDSVCDIEAASQGAGGSLVLNSLQQHQSSNSDAPSSSKLPVLSGAAPAAGMESIMMNSGRDRADLLQMLGSRLEQQLGLDVMHGSMPDFASRSSRWGIVSSSIGFMSDSFERPGSEYGELPTAASDAELNAMVEVMRGELQQQDRLTIYSVLGSGANAVVYKGEWRGRPVAVKTLLFQEHRIHTKRLALQEVAVNSRFCHPNIIMTYSFDFKPITAGSEPSGLPIDQARAHTGDWKLYIVQEYADAGHLKRCIDSGRLQSDSQTAHMLSVVQLALDIACGVQHVHSKGIIHGDLSPANILLKTDHNRPGLLQLQAKVGDFGLSKNTDNGQSHISHARQGTPFYTAPEVLGQGLLSRCSDVFSLGVILHELYCGQPVWRAKAKADAQNMARKARRQESGYATNASGPCSLQVASGTVMDPPQPPVPASMPPFAAVPITAPSAHAAGVTHPSSQVCADSQGAETTGMQIQTNGRVSAASECGHAQPITSTVDIRGMQLQAQTNTTHSRETLAARVNAVQRWLMQGEGDCPFTFPGTCPQWYAELITSCLAYRPEQRPKLPQVVQLLLTKQTEYLAEYAAMCSLSNTPSSDSQFMQLSSTLPTATS